MSKRKNIVLILIFAICCLLVILLFHPFTKIPSVADSQILEDRITFTPDDGKESVELTPAQAAEAQARTGGVYTSYYTIPAWESDCFPVLSYVFGIGEVELSLDGNILFSGTVGGADSIASTSNFTFSVTSEDAGKTLIAKVRYTDPEFYILPGILMVTISGQKEKQNAAITNAAAVPAGVAGISFLIVAGLFLMSLAISSADYSLPFLALGIMCYCILRLFDTGVLDFPNILYTLRDTVLPCACEVFILIYVILNRKKKILKYFLDATGLLCVLIIAATILRHVLDRAPALVLEFSALADFVLYSDFKAIISLISNYLIVICVVVSLLYHIQNLIEISSEKVMLESNARAVMAGYDKMVESIKETSAVRHEWKHDLLTLSLLYDQGKIGEIGTYLQEKTEFIKENEWESFTGCFVLDTILNFVSAKAKSEHVKLKTYVNVPADLDIKEDALCQLLMNMFDNAFHACAKLEENRFIDFTAILKNGCLGITCSNSTPPAEADSRGSKDPEHGYGIKNMTKICQRYGSDLIIDEKTDGIFTLKTALQLGREEE